MIDVPNQKPEDKKLEQKELQKPEEKKEVEESDDDYQDEEEFDEPEDESEKTIQAKGSMEARAVIESQKALLTSGTSKETLIG